MRIHCTDPLIFRSRNSEYPICHMTISHNSSLDAQINNQKKKRMTVGTGVYMNHSIIFTEISFYPETSILLQIVMNNSYDISDMNQNLTEKVDLCLL